MACDSNKILRVALAPGTAGLNSMSNIPEPGFSVYISQLLLVGSVVRQDLLKGHRRHFFPYPPKFKIVAESPCFTFRASSSPWFGEDATPISVSVTILEESSDSIWED